MDLLKNQNPEVASAPLGPFDGRVGAIAQIGPESYYITTNTDYIPMPQASQAVYLRPDMRFGVDDPTLWPQPFSETFPHLAAIRKRGSSPDLEVMWWTPSEQHFSPGNAITRSLGRLHPSALNKFSDPVNSLIKRYNSYVASLGAGEKPSNLLEEVALNLMFSLERLQSLPTTFDKMRFCIACLQIGYLELEALLSFITVYQPRMKLLHAEAPSDVAPCMGTFTFRPDVAQKFHAAGLPYWFLRPFHAFDNENILKVVSPITPPAVFTLEGLRVGEPLHQGMSIDGKIRAMGNFCRQMSWYHDPFAADPNAQAETSSAVAPAHSQDSSQQLSSTGSVHRTPNPPRPTPCKLIVYCHILCPSKTHLFSDDRRSRSQNASQNPPAKVAGSGRDKFQPLAADEMPGYINAWSAALAQIDVNSTTTAAPSDKHYAFPEPALLASADSLLRRNKFLHHWIILQDAFLFVASQTTLRLSSQEWREILQGHVERSDQQRNKRTKNARTLQTVIAPVLSTLATDILSSFPPPVEQIPTYDVLVFKQVIWQLAEINFRCEFLSLDRRASGLRREGFVQKCFAGGLVFDVPLRLSKEGLASQDIGVRHRYHVRMARLMVDWKFVRCHRPQWIGRSEARERQGGKWTQDEMVELEWAVARYYTESFFELYGRAAVLPMRLEHDFVDMPVAVVPA
ncbi:hypothetical protein R3P38DRAFT_3305134 [Favolaschia claudopus]|uniref:Uncharacterized protein n=1 Tax=Favolaschia claudopus TaxID=2862362 RepID=A0AAW0DR82_9AGAR